MFMELVLNIHGEGGITCAYYCVQENVIAEKDALTESDKQRQRRHAEAEKRRMLEQRERKGLKPWFLDVTRGGVPFGAGVQAWRREIKKLARVHLDPSCTNIRMQDESDMATLKRAMHVNFEYSRLPSDSQIQTVAGRAVSVYRNELMARISRGEEMPLGFDEE
jgi:hypothetical protein